AADAQSSPGIGRNRAGIGCRRLSVPRRLLRRGKSAEGQQGKRLRAHHRQAPQRSHRQRRALLPQGVQPLRQSGEAALAWGAILMADNAPPGPPQFPAGPPVVDEQPPDERRRAAWVDEIERAPARLRETVSGLSDQQLDTKYRNWTIRQIVHHLADSHVNSYVRFKWTLTE